MRSAYSIAVVWASTALAACSGSVANPGTGSVLAAAGSGAPAASGPQASGGAGVGAPGTTAAGGGGSATPASTSRTIPARIRRLSNAEFDRSVTTLLGVDSTFGKSFTPDTRQDGFTRNDAQRVDPVFIAQLDTAAQQLARTAREKVAQLAPCADAAGSEACARTFLTGFAKRAYRRPASDRELDALVSVYRAGADGASYADGIQATVQAVLESPGFLYVTELGDVPLQASATLNEYETASALAYLLTGAPPDDALLQAAANGQLHLAETRKTQAQRLLALPTAGAQITRMVEEWLGIDAITQTAKDSNTYPDFAGLRDAMKQESDDFVSEVMWKSAGSVSDLLSADWTIASDPLARMYLNATGGQAITRTGNHVSLASVPRRGILDQGAFLSVFAHANETGPVLRGVALLRRVACVNIPSPSSLNINVVPPVPDPKKTTRERFVVHTQDPACAACHTNIDALGFTFENLDGMGRLRTMENGHPIDSATDVMGGYPFDGHYADSSALVVRMAQSPDVSACFARKLFRYAAASSDADTQGVEAAFLASASALPAGAQGKFADVLLSFIASDAFVQRGASL
jgi:hypothetical protein